MFEIPTGHSDNSPVHDMIDNLAFNYN